MKLSRARTQALHQRRRLRTASVAALAVTALTVLVMMGITSGSASGNPTTCPAGSHARGPDGTPSVRPSA